MSFAEKLSVHRTLKLANILQEFPTSHLKLVILATLGLRKWRQCTTTPNLLMKINHTQHLAFVMEV
jgi:hypothetical protein